MGDNAEEMAGKPLADVVGYAGSGSKIKDFFETHTNRRSSHLPLYYGWLKLVESGLLLSCTKSKPFNLGRFLSAAPLCVCVLVCCY